MVLGKTVGKHCLPRGCIPIGKLAEMVWCILGGKVISLPIKFLGKECDMVMKHSLGI